MFGKQDDEPSQEVTDDALDKPADDTAATGDSGSEQPTDQIASQPTGQLSDPKPDEPATIKPELDSDNPPEEAKTLEPAAEPQPDNDNPNWQHPGIPLDDEKGNEQISDIISPAGGYPTRTSYQYSTGGSPDSSDDDPATHELIDIKHQALGELSPLVNQLDLPPEEKFQAIMMVLQDSDDQALVKAAFDTAHSIKDEKTRGLALLSIVNEINYFTQPPAKPE